MEIIISGENKKAIKLIEELAKELGLTIQLKTSIDEEKEQEIRSEKLYQLMTEMAQSGSFESIKDPVAWQREIRKDRPLPGRD